MKLNKHIIFILNINYFILTLLFILDSLSTFDIKSQELKYVVYYGLISGTIICLLVNLFLLKSKVLRVIGIVLPGIQLISILLIGPLNILFSSGTWKTQKILYQNQKNESKKIELQMQDVGALGINERIVGIQYLSNYFMLIIEIPINIENNKEWKEANIDINELGIKYP